MIPRSDDERFQRGAHDYAAYLETPEGRMRTELAFSNLCEFLPVVSGGRPRHALDIGCGTGAAGVRLAGLGFHVTQLDPSEAMLEIARRAAQEAGIVNRLTFTHGDAAHLSDLLGAASFDTIICHNVLEYVDDPLIVLRVAASALRDTSSILSVVVRNRIGEVLKAAIQAGDLEAAEVNLTAEWGTESLFGGRVRLFTLSNLRAMFHAESLHPIAERGIRALADYLPPQLSGNNEYARILQLETKLSSRPEFAAIARYTQCITRRMESAACKA
jgi:S-adenosylmethionine-dependent methyltransferase